MLGTSRRQQLFTFAQSLGLDAQSPIRWDLLDLALIHPSVVGEQNYERLEFVGDAVIKLAAAQFLYETYPNESEGNLSAIRAALVSDRSLARVAHYYQLDHYLLVGSSARGDKVGQETRLAAALEAVLAALYLSLGNLNLIRPWLDVHLKEAAENIRLDPTFQNYKGALQALTQAHHQLLPEYRVQEIGQTYGDQERFLAEVWLLGQLLGQGKGKSKKAAEQEAARAAFETLQNAILPKPTDS